MLGALRQSRLAKLANVSRWRAERARRNVRRGLYQLEPLEPRYLLSADFLPAAPEALFDEVMLEPIIEERVFVETDAFCAGGAVARRHRHRARALPVERVAAVGDVADELRDDLPPRAVRRQGILRQRERRTREPWRLLRRM